MTDVDALQTQISARFPDIRVELAFGELTLDVLPEKLHETCFALRDEPLFDFKMLIDVCGVDYLHYGLSEWETESATATGFERGVDHRAINNPHLTGPRYAAVYHLLSLTQNHRIRIRVFLDEHNLKVPSVINIWPSANWFEREAFDLFGITFEDHPDLRRLLTDYGFAGHPFRKDFPLIGRVEARYDAKSQRVVYEPVSIQPRILEPKVIRRDNRYQVENTNEKST
ncbi:MAG TPA: NADH-quinone oxidoreductase subunit C [Gammaproteobacteria bacterium]|nr:NADH-quinone oxidoreductase subunit C [Gammaproteobacteria bacterium]